MSETVLRSVSKTDVAVLLAGLVAGGAVARYTDVPAAAIAAAFFVALAARQYDESYRSDTRLDVRHSRLLQVE